MSDHYSNPTANAAIGAVDRELNRMRRQARRLRRLRDRGLLPPEAERAARRQFTGIYRSVLKQELG